jgi:D-alanyl-D-alanine carboxypeptidase
MTTEHILRIGSVTKNFTAAIILKLYEQGEISLEDKIHNWFPEYPNSDLITIRQLLNHSSGIYNYTENTWLGVQSVLWRNKKWDPNTLLKSTRNQQPRPKGPGYVVLIRCCTQGFNAFNRPKAPPRSGERALGY